jgi:hypothetical protein
VQEGLTISSRNAMNMKYALNDGQGLKSNTSLPNHIFRVGKVVRRLILATVSRNDAVSIT